MSNLMDLRRASAYDAEQAQASNPLFALANGFGSSFSDAIINNMKEEADRKKRQNNVADQLKTYNSMMEQMAEMPDNSGVGKASSLTDDKVKQRRIGAVGVSTMIPTREVSFDENGINMKLGFKSASPTDQKNLIDIEKTQSEMSRADNKRNFLTSYISGQIDEGAFLKEVGNLGLTPDEFESATSARTRLNSLNNVQGGTQIPMGFQADEMGVDKFGNVIPSRITRTKIPTEQDLVNLQISKANLNKAITPEVETIQGQLGASQLEKNRMDIENDKRNMVQTQENIPEGFQVTKYETDKFGNRKPVVERIPVADIKAQRDIMAEDKANKQKAQGTIKSAEDAVKTIDHLINNVNFFGAIEGNMPAGMNNAKREWAKNFNYLKAKNVLNVMNELKSQSRTGASGFGALNEKELALIENASMVLDKAMDEKTATKYLNEMKSAAQTIIDREKNGYPSEVGGNPQSVGVPSVGGTFNGEKVISVKRIR